MKTIATTDWIMSIFLLTATIGVFAGLNGVKVGWFGSIASIFGIVLKGALSVVWLYSILACILVSVVLAAIASILLKNGAIKELIVGVQKYKTADNKAEVNETLKCMQSNPTQKLVQTTKATLKLKGTI